MVKTLISTEMTTGTGAADGGPSSGTYGFPKSEASAATYRGYPAKPPTLRAAVKSCDAEGVQGALVKLDSNAEAALDATDGVGRTLLHLSSSQPLRPGTQQVVQLLLAHRARPQVADANEQTPLALAMAAVAKAEVPEGLPEASAVITSLLDARAEVAGDAVVG